MGVLSGRGLKWSSEVAGDQSRRGFDAIEPGDDSTRVNEWISALERAVQAAQTRAEGLEVRTAGLAADVGEARQRLRGGGPLSYGELGARLEQVLRQGEDQANDLIAAAWSGCADLLVHVQVEAAQVRAQARQKAEELQAGVWQVRSRIRQDAETRAETLTETAARKSEGILGAAARETQLLRTATEVEIRKARASVEGEVAGIQAPAEREAAQVRARADAEVVALQSAAEREAAQLRAVAFAVLRDADEKVDRGVTALESELAARRQESERWDVEQNEIVTACVAQVVGEAEERAAAVEEQTEKAIEWAAQVVNEADEHAQQLMATTREFADRVLAEASNLAYATVAQVREEVEPHLRAAQRRVDDLTTQRDRILAHLEQLLHLLGMVPGPDGLPDGGELMAVRRLRELILRVKASGEGDGELSGGS